MKNRLLYVCLILSILLSGSLLVDKIGASGSDPGTVTDPLVTKSYVDLQMNTLMQTVEEKLASGSGTNTPQPNSMTEIYKYIDDQFKIILANGGVPTTTLPASEYVVVVLKKDEKLICEASTELILRAGNATAIQGEKGDGLPDLTSGVEIMQGETVAEDHLIIIPRTDGRGITANKECYVMVKGKYTIQ